VMPQLRVLLACTGSKDAALEGGLRGRGDPGGSIDVVQIPLLVLYAAQGLYVRGDDAGDQTQEKEQYRVRAAVDSINVLSKLGWYVLLPHTYQRWTCACLSNDSVTNTICTGGGPSFQVCTGYVTRGSTCHT
jgi:hypothetical protein